MKYRKQHLCALVWVVLVADVDPTLKIKETSSISRPDESTKKLILKGKNSERRWEDCEQRQLGIFCKEKSSCKWEERKDMHLEMENTWLI